MKIWKNNIIKIMEVFNKIENNTLSIWSRHNLLAQNQNMNNSME